MGTYFNIWNLKRADKYKSQHYTNHKYVEQFLSTNGAPCSCIKYELGARVCTYHIQLEDAMDIGKIPKIVKALSSEVHQYVTQSFSSIGNFALVIPCADSRMIGMGDIYDNFGTKNHILEGCLGEDACGNLLKIDIADMPHILVAGATGSGKSVCVNSLIASLLLNEANDNIQMMMIDPKQVEFKCYEGLPQLARPIATSPADAITALRGACNFMDARYKLIAERGYKNAKQMGMPPLLIVIDELADLMLTSKYEAEECIVRLAQLGRAASIHLIIATQRPTVNVITGLIKSNMPCRIALQVASIRDSMNILDHKGAETLLGKGDGLLKLPDRVNEIRFQSSYCTEKEIEYIVQYQQKKHGS